MAGCDKPFRVTGLPLRLIGAYHPSGNDALNRYRTEGTATEVYVSSRTSMNLHGRPLRIFEEMSKLVDLRGRIKRGSAPGKSRSDWGKRLAELIQDVAHTTNIDPAHFAALGDWVVAAIQNERTTQYLASCGITSKTKAA